jgi:leucyl aminopeptidase (aminopeptidase T)
LKYPNGNNRDATVQRQRHLIQANRDYGIRQEVNMHASNSGLISGTLEYLRRPLVANVQQGATVLIVTDTAHDARVWQAMMTILADLHADATVALFEPRPADYYDPPAAVCSAMLKSDLNVLLATTAMLHSPAAAEAMAAGVPSLCMDGGLTLEMFQAGGVTADYGEIAHLKYWVAKNVYGAGAREVRVTSRFGTDITYSVEGRIFIPPPPTPDRNPLRAYKRSEEGRTGGLYACVYPTGEFNVPPVEGSANGRVVIDLTMHHVGRIYSPIAMDVREGRIACITGGAEAKILRDYIETYGDDNAYFFPTEASIGINKKARITGNQREDKNIYGCMHFGLGTNEDVGGALTSKLHMDGVVLEPTVWVDGQMRIRDGKFLVSLEG